MHVIRLWQPGARFKASGSVRREVLELAITRRSDVA